VKHAEIFAKGERKIAKPNFLSRDEPEKSAEKDLNRDN
jgi:uncharacterized protein (DUF362 family)